MVKHLLAGIAKADITPSDSVPMAGYMARTGWSLGVHDPLWVKCFVFHSGQECGAFVVLDLLSIRDYWVDKVKHEVGKAAAVPPERVVVVCTHTHSGPSGFDTPLPNGPNRLVLLEITEKMLMGIRSAAGRAAQTMSPVRIGVGAVTVNGVAGHRTHPERPVDQTLWALVIREPEGTLRGVIANFPVHSTVLGPENRLLSGDLLGTAAAFAEQQLGGNVVVGLTCGAAGDISTRFFRQSQTFSELNRLGRILSDAIVSLVQQINVTSSADFAIHQHRCWLPYKSAPSVEEVQPLVERRRTELNVLLRRPEVTPGALRIARTQLEGAELLLDLVKKGVLVSGGVETCLVGMRIGNGILIGFPGEPFNIVAKTVRDNAPAGFFATVMGLTDGYLGYFPDQEAVEGRWYEALASPFDDRATVVLVEGAQKLLRKLA